MEIVEFRDDPVDPKENEQTKEAKDAKEREDSFSDFHMKVYLSLCTADCDDLGYVTSVTTFDFHRCNTRFCSFRSICFTFNLKNLLTVANNCQYGFILFMIVIYRLTVVVTCENVRFRATLRN